MQITYLGHAGFCVETSQAIIVMDPWFSTKGAFDSAWFQFPRNHHMAAFVQEKLKHEAKERFIYISHEHKDHFDADFLSSLQSSNFTFITPRFRRDELRRTLSEYPSKGVLATADNEEVSLPGGHIRLFLYDNELNRDSAILVKAQGYSFLNLNDCKIYDSLPTITREEGPIDVFTCQFSGASWHPTSYDYSRKDYEAIARKKMFSKFMTVARSIETVGPRVFIPSAGPPCFLDPQLFHLNFEPVNIFPRASSFVSFLKKTLRKRDVGLPELMPGDLLDVATGAVSYLTKERVDDENYDAYLHAYASDYKAFFAERRSQSQKQDADLLLNRLGAEFKNKLSFMTLNDRIRTRLFVRLSELPDKMLSVDFPSKSVEYASHLPETEFYSITIPSWELARALDGAITWDDLFLTLRVRFNRAPDIYQTVIHGFMSMQAEDMDSFCTRILEFESRQERIVVEAGGVRYSIRRYCPHQGGDLTQGWIEEDRYVTCPRHRWQYDLLNGGRCTLVDATIDAVSLEDD